MNSIKNLLNKIILYHNAPTLFDRKPATLINFTASNQLYELWSRYSRVYFKQLMADLQLNTAIDYAEIRHQTGKHVLVLFYNPERLENTLLNPENQYFLASLGYTPTPTIIGYLNQLSRRIGYSPGFPHEIGIFLGFPLSDVKGFIANHGKNYILNQYWKVYHNPRTAKKIFASYDRAKIDLIEKLKQLTPYSPHWPIHFNKLSKLV